MRIAPLLALAAVPTGAAAETAAEIRFVTCPIYRDTDAGKKSGCWLAEDPATGTRWDVTASASKPDWNRAVLVEGRASGEAIDPCGGPILDPVRVSIVDRACPRAMLPAEGYKGRRFALPPRNLRPLYEAREAAKPPFTVRTFVIPFDFGSDFITYQLSDYYLDQAVAYALDVGPARIEIVGHAATAPDIVSGVPLVEPVALARSRAEKAGEWMRLRGIPVDRVTLRWATDVSPSPDAAFDGLLAPSPRRVEITITPAG